MLVTGYVLVNVWIFFSKSMHAWLHTYSYISNEVLKWYQITKGIDLLPIIGDS